MAKKDFTVKEYMDIMLLHKCLFVSNNGNYESETMFIATPSTAKLLVKLGLIEISFNVIPKRDRISWYKLTKLCKKFMSSYVHTFSTHEEITLFYNKILPFDYNYYKYLKESLDNKNI